MNLPSLEIEKKYWALDRDICGVDEVGRGCLAGPVVAATVLLPKSHKQIPGIRDSKKLSLKKREYLFNEILSGARDFGIGLVSAKEIDLLGIVGATKKAMISSIDALLVTPDMVVVDSLFLEDLKLDQINIDGADSTCYSVACASIVAKVFRDRIMMGLENFYPNYNFSAHKGYGTRLHYEEITSFGLTDEHRRSFLKKYKKAYSFGV